MLGADHDNDVQEAILQPGHAVLSSELCAWYEEVDCGEHGEEGQVQRAQDGGGGEARAGGGGLCSGLFVFKDLLCKGNYSSICRRKYWEIYTSMVMGVQNLVN